MEKGKIKELLQFQAQRKITSLYKNFLCILEDLQGKNKIDKEEYQRLRKRVLDLGNDLTREMEDELDRIFEIL